MHLPNINITLVLWCIGSCLVGTIMYIFDQACKIGHVGTNYTSRSALQQDICILYF